LIGFFGSSKKRVVELKITVNSKNRDSKLKNPDWFTIEYR
jgi:hypothetical protein